MSTSATWAIFQLKNIDRKWNILEGISNSSWVSCWWLGWLGLAHIWDQPRTLNLHVKTRNVPLVWLVPNTAPPHLACSHIWPTHHHTVLTKCMDLGSHIDFEVWWQLYSLKYEGSPLSLLSLLLGVISPPHLLPYQNLKSYDFQNVYKRCVLFLFWGWFSLIAFYKRCVYMSVMYFSRTVLTQRPVSNEIILFEVVCWIPSSKSNWIRNLRVEGTGRGEVIIQWKYWNNNEIIKHNHSNKSSTVVTTSH